MVFHLRAAKLKIVEMDEKTAIQLVGSFINKHGYTAKRLQQKVMPQGQKSPDFEVYEGEELEFLCELKTVEMVPNPVTNMFHWNTTVSKLREHTSKAYKQFVDHDREHRVPRALFFISTHMQLNWTSMVHSLRGAVAFNGQLIKDLTNQRFIQATDIEVKDIDIFVWGQANAKHNKIYQMVFFVNASSKFSKASNDIVDNLIPFESEDVTDMNIKKYKNIPSNFK